MSVKQALAVIAFVYIFGKLMTLAIGARRNVEIICNTHSDVVFFNDANINKKVEVQRNNNCKAHGLSNMPNLQCGCNVDFLAACNLSIVKEEYGCYKWNCGSGSNYSHSVDVCLSVDQTSHTMVSTVKCANVQRTPKVEFWTVDERILSSNYDEIRMIKLDQLNISIITALFKQEENRSIVVCKLEENYNTEWSITLILPWTHCVDEQLYKSPSSSTNHTCQTTKGNPVITRQLEEYTDPKCPSVRIHSNVNVTLCDAVNTDDMGARTFVKDKIGSFKLEVINPAIVREFYIDEFRDRVNISLNGGRKVTLICEGDGNPPPTVTLVSKSSIFNTSASPLRYTIEYPSRQDTGEYLCIASNGLGNNSKSIHVEIIIKGEEGSILITISICVGSAILIIIVAMCLLRRRCELLKNRHIKDATIEIATVEAVNWSSSSRVNNGTGNEEEVLSNTTHQRVNTSIERVRKTRGFCNEAYVDYNPCHGKKDNTDNTIEGKYRNEQSVTSANHGQGIPGFCNEAYAGWVETSPSHTGDSQSKGSCKNNDRNSHSSIELADCTYSVVNKNTRKHMLLDYSSQGSFCSDLSTTKEKKEIIYSMAKEPNEEDIEI